MHPNTHSYTKSYTISPEMKALQGKYVGGYFDNGEFKNENK